MNKQKKVIWVIGTIILGMIVFLAYMWGIFQAWGAEGYFWLYPIGSVGTVLVL